MCPHCGDTDVRVVDLDLIYVRRARTKETGEYLRLQLICMDCGKQHALKRRVSESWTIHPALASELDTILSRSME